jgi:UDP-N-acetylglucosamine--N-acetylmuramyl-(pentapeptide) pyrophosphoryl-undecaprenol N-acetylglucosamine transferase
MARRVIVIAGGGTGGHIFPGLAVAAELRALVGEDLPIVWIGARRGQEGHLVPAHELPLRYVAAARIVGGSLPARLRGVGAVPAGVVQALWHLLRLKPRVVLGVGGYASAATGLAAWMLRVPLVVQEQNALPGRTNRKLGRLARRVAVAFDEALPYFPEGRAVVTGNPVRAAIRTTRPVCPDPEGPRRVLVVGGSQGARFLNERVPALLKRVHRAGRPLEVVHQSGVADAVATRVRYAETGLAATVESFIADMAAAYDRADLVIGRAGATTVAELKCAGRGALFVPFPFAADDHQARNAEAMVAAGAAHMVRQEAWNEAALADELFAALAADRLRDMAARAAGLARPDAARRVAELVLETALPARGRQARAARGEETTA